MSKITKALELLHNFQSKIEQCTDKEFPELHRAIELLEQKIVKETAYDWDTIPAWCNYIATDADREVWGYARKPKRTTHMWHSYDIGEMSRLFNITPITPWKKSLCKRPS